VFALAFGTACWTIAGAELWTHGPDVFWLSLAVLGMSRERYWLAGAAFGPAVLTRPHLVLVALPLGLWATWHRRHPMPLIQFGVPGALALLVMFRWNAWYYGQGSVSGAYGGHIERAVAGSGGVIPSFWENILGTTFSPWCGVLLFSPVVLVGLLAVPRHAGAAPGWTKAAAVGAALYLVGQFRVANFDGGGAQYGNRYLIEPMLLVLPLALPAAESWARGIRWRRILTLQLAAWSVAIYATGAFLAPFWQGIPGDWVAWYPYVVLRAAGPTGVIVAACALASIALVGLLSWQRQADVADQILGVVPAPQLT
jgi:hypothetical protein